MRREGMRARLPELSGLGGTVVGRNEFKKGSRAFAFALPPAAAAAANRVNAPFKPAFVSKIIAVVVTPSPVRNPRQMYVEHRKETKGKLR